jgi:predicted kinase
MRPPVIICVRGNPNSGKTTTIADFADTLEKRYRRGKEVRKKIFEIQGEKVAVHSAGDVAPQVEKSLKALLNGEKVAVHSAGDVAPQVEKNLKALLNGEKVAVIVCAARLCPKQLYRESATVKAVKRVAKEYGCALEWVDKNGKPDDDARAEIFAKMLNAIANPQ